MIDARSILLADNTSKEAKAIAARLVAAEMLLKDVQDAPTLEMGEFLVAVDRLATYILNGHLDVSEDTGSGRSQ